MLTFFPGPSKLPEYLPDLYAAALAEGLGSISHRSPAFEAAYGHTVAQLQQKLDIPEGYQVVFASSATECWEILTQSLVQGSALHLHSGSFGAKWADYAQRIRPAVEAISFDLNTDPTPLLAHLGPHHEALCLTHNETSNGTLLPNTVLDQARQALGPERLLLLDCTSSMAGVSLPWHLGDVWFASVQKCLGQPAGLAILVLSPRAIARAEALGDTRHYNSLIALLQHARQNQTSYTPNVLAIAVLGRHLERCPGIAETEATICARAQVYYDWVARHPALAPLVTTPALQSPTVVAIAAAPDTLASHKEAALAQGMRLGNGYGPWKDSTYRIANFPAYTAGDQARLLAALSAA